MVGVSSTGSISRAFFTLGLILVSLAGSSPGLAQAPTTGQGKVKIEWLGHEFYRLTSPKGVVILTSPWLANPDGAVAVNDLARTDFAGAPLDGAFAERLAAAHRLPPPHRRSRQLR